MHRDTIIKKLKDIYTHLTAITDSRQLGKEVNKELIDVIAELTKEKMDKESYEDKWLIETPFGFIRLDTTIDKVQSQSTTYNNQMFYTMEEIERIAPKYKAFSVKVDNKVLAELYI